MLILAAHTVDNALINSRLSDYVCGLFDQLPSNKSVKKAIKRGAIRLNNKQVESGRFVIDGDLVQLIDSEDQPPKNFKIDLEVVYEDDYIAIINKPAGFVVSGNRYRTIENALLGSVQLSKAVDALKWPKPVHRLDAATQGLLLIAKTA